MNIKLKESVTVNQVRLFKNIKYFSKGLTEDGLFYIVIIDGFSGSFLVDKQLVIDNVQSDAFNENFSKANLGVISKYIELLEAKVKQLDYDLYVEYDDGEDYKPVDFDELKIAALRQE